MWRRTILALALVAAPAPALAAETVVPPPMVIVGAVEPPAFGFRMPQLPIDNVRLGLTQLQGGGIPRLFGGGAGVSLGLDVPLTGGLALAFDSMHLRRDAGTSDYWLMVNPVQLRYRLGLGSPTAAIRPYLSAGAGLTAMGLFGDGDRPKLGLGPAFSGGAGLMLPGGLALEGSLQGGQGGQVPYWGWAFRAGTTFGTVGRWPGAPAVAPVVQQPAAPSVTVRGLTGKVLEVAGTRLTIGYEQVPTEGVGDEVLVFYEDGITVKVARARVEALTADGRAIARVLVSTEPVRRGYLVRGW